MNYYPKPILPEVQLLKRDTTLPLGTKAVPGVRVKGFHGPYTLYVVGQFKAVTPTTGSQTGTAGVGTTTTSVVKPTGAANWTASDSALLGKYVRVLSGGGLSTNPKIPTMRAILAVSTTALTVKAISGMDSTTVFDIVSSDTVVDTSPAAVDPGVTTCVEVSDNTCRVVFVGLRFTSSTASYNVYSRRNRRVTFHACEFAADPVVDTFNSDEDGTCGIYDSTWTAASNASIQYANRAIVDRCYGSAMETLLIDRCHSVTAGINAVSSTGNTLAIKRANNVTVEMAASTCAATPAVFETCQRVDITALTGTGNTGYGVDISKGGVYNLTGATITGTTGDFIIDGVANVAVTWADASSYGAHTRWGTTLLITGGANTTRMMDTIRAEGNFDVTAQGLVSGTGGTLQLGGRVINYGYVHWAFNDSLTAFATGGQASATQLGFGENIVTVCATNADSAKLPLGAAIGGVQVFVKNLGAADLAVFPPVGGKIDALATNASVTIAAGASTFFFSRDSGSGLDFVQG